MPVTHAEQVLERRTQQVDDHDVVVALLAGPVDPGDTRAAHEGLVDLALLLERRGFCNGRLELDGHLFACDGVNALEDGSCSRESIQEWRKPEERDRRTTTTDCNLLLKAVFATESVGVHGVVVCE